MIKHKQSTRSLVAFLVTWSFLVLTVTGIVLYIVPHGHIAFRVHWSLLGLEKEQWAGVHMMFGGNPTPEDIEARYAGSGLGRKAIAGEKIAGGFDALIRSTRLFPTH